MGLVSSHKQDQQSTATLDNPKRPTTSKKHSGIDTEGDVDLQRALDLSNLHSEMKEKHGKGAEMDKALDEARRKVMTVFSQVSLRT